MKKSKNAFVLIELIVVFGMLAVLIGFTTFNIFGAQKKANLVGMVDTLVTDLRSQQTKAMTAISTSGVVPLGYGIRFEDARYILFQGLTYTVSDTSNIVIPLDTRATFNSIQLPNSSIVFASQSGEFVGWTSGLHSVSLHHIDSGETKTIQVNQYGVISAIN
jgi:type II secretory pathway pseudopilin PulG